jgi:anhydro-N-acetylmuramic acid kinase
MNKLFLGALSGTSMDSIDIALFNFSDNKVQCLGNESAEFPEKIKKEILSIIIEKHDNEIDNLIHDELGFLFSQSIIQLLSKLKIDHSDVCCIGMHGQTLSHNPTASPPISLQLGNPQIVANNTQIKTVADFREKDINSGGQGAPLAPLFHNYVFRRAEANTVVLNIGGLSNISILPSAKEENVSGFDTGPGNTLLDQWVQKIKKESFDHDGAWARTGKVSKELLDIMLSDTFFSLDPPKSTSVEHFNLRWLKKKLQGCDKSLSNEDIQATLVELTASTIADSIKTKSINELIICGGGVYNSFLLERIITKIGKNIKIKSPLEYGIHPKLVEAGLFAWLAMRHIENKPVDTRNITGATEPNLLLGKLYETK